MNQSDGNVDSNNDIQFHLSTYSIFLSELLNRSAVEAIHGSLICCSWSENKSLKLPHNIAHVQHWSSNDFRLEHSIHRGNQGSLTDRNGGCKGRA